MELNKCFGCMEEIQGYPCPHCGFDPRSVKGIEYALPMGTILAGKYLVGRVLGQGGFGITYVGWDIALERKVAIKEYYPSGQVSRNPGSRGLTWYTSVQSQQAKQNGTQIFLKEARKMSKVDDIPNVVRVRDLFQENETAYIVMDFVEGETLKARLEKTGPLPWEQAKGIFLPAIQAMEQVHQAGLVHRDISPDNLMLTPDGKVKILDLGAAKDLSINSGASSMQVAKGGFSPFEQYTQRGSSGPWTDVYAMAATVYYTLTGKLPPVATDRVVEDTISWEEPGLKALSAQALEALQKAMVISAKNRMQSMEELEKGLYSTAVEPAPTPAPQPVQEARPEPQPEQEAKPAPQPTPEPAPQAQSEPKPKAGEKSGKKLWIAAAAVIAVVLCGALVWANAGKPADDTDTAAFAATTPTTVPTVAATAAPTTKMPVSIPSPATLQSLAEEYGRKKVVAAGDHFAVGIKPDGSCIAAGNPKPYVSSWTGMCSLSACGDTVAGLRSDGTVVCSDPTLNVRNWKDIVQIDYFEGLWGEDHHIVGLTSSGKVVAEGTNRYGECDVSGWEDIVDVAAGATHTVGLRSDGTVVACGNNEYGQCNVSDWVGIVDVAAARYAVYGLTSDGHILVTGQKPLYEGGLMDAVLEVPTPEVSGWDNIVAILASCEGGDGCDYVVGIREDGTIVTNRSTWAYLDDGDIESFQDVRCIDVASWGYTICVDSYGKVRAVGWDVDGTRIVDTWSLMEK